MLQKYHKKVLASKLFNNLILLKFLIYNKNYFKNNYHDISFSRFQNEKNITRIPLINFHVSQYQLISYNYIYLIYEIDLPTFPLADNSIFS